MIARRTFIQLGAAAIAASSCSRASSEAPSNGRPAAVHVITMEKMTYGPLPRDVRVGDTIEWYNQDIFIHTATARNGSFDVEIKPKQRVRMTLAKPGEIAFYCRYHPGMTGSLLVAV
jgi:plastocyanin